MDTWSCFFFSLSRLMAASLRLLFVSVLVGVVAFTMVGVLTIGVFCGLGITFFGVVGWTTVVSSATDRMMRLTSFWMFVALSEFFFSEKLVARGGRRFGVSIIHSLSSDGRECLRAADACLAGDVYSWWLFARATEVGRWSPFICFSWQRCKFSNFSSISGLRFSCLRAFFIAVSTKKKTTKNRWMIKTISSNWMFNLIVLNSYPRHTLLNVIGRDDCRFRNLLICTFFCAFFLLCGSHRCGWLLLLLFLFSLFY